MLSTPSIYISDIIRSVEKESGRTYEEVENAFFKQYLYPAGEVTYFDASDKPQNWLEESLVNVLSAQGLSYVQFHE